MKILKEKKINKYVSRNILASNEPPINTNLPSANKQIRSNISNISLDGWCIVHNMVFPFLLNCLMHSTIDTAIYESKPLVGSSQNNKFGFVIIWLKVSFLFFFL